MKAMKQILPLATVALALATYTTCANPFSPGNLVIYRVGDGGAALGTTAAAVFLDEYTPLGTLVQSIALPTTGAGQIAATGNSTTEGIMSLSQDGTRAIFTGYRTAVGSSGFTGSSKVIGTVGLNGVVDTSSFAVTDVGVTAIRSATSVDGSSSFYIGSGSAVRYVGTPGAAATSVSIDARNSRQVFLSGNKLFASNGSTGVTGKVQDYGILPTTTTAANPDVVLATADAVNGFALFDLSPTVAGNDTLYALSTVEGLLRKYTFNGTSWSANGSISSSSSQDLTGYADGSGVHLFLTSGSTLFSELDSSGYGANITGALASLGTAGDNTGFRGVVMIPEPSGLLVFGLATLLLGRKLIRRKA